MKTARLSVPGVGLALILAGCATNPSGGGSGGDNGSGGSGSGGVILTGNGGSGGSSSSGGSTGSGGSQSSGGSTGSGGSVSGNGGSSSGGATGSGGAKGGNTGSGGATSSGGNTGSGGTTSTGGAGGATSAGGNTGSGGATSTGGSTGSGGAAGASGAVTVQLGMTEQVIEGFGINDNWAAGSTPAALFQTSGSGLGLTILRTGMSDTGAFYNSGESSGDVATLKSGAGSDAKLIGSVWSPPANCKSNNSVNDGGTVMTSCYTSWGTTIANFAGSNGFYAMSIANEPDFASCGSADPCNGNYPTTLFTAQQMVAYTKVAGPLLKAKGVKVIAPEASEWLHQWSNVSAGPDVGGHESSDPLKCGCFPDKNTNSCASACTSGMGYDYGHALAADSTAWAAIDIVGVHEYDSQSAVAWPSDVNSGKPNKEVWQTEMSGVKWWPEQGPSCDIANGVKVAGSDPLRAHRRPGLGLALVVVPGLRNRRQRRSAAQERQQRERLQRGRHQAPLHARELQQVHPPRLPPRGRHRHDPLERAAFCLPGLGRHGGRGGHQQQHLDGERADHHLGWDVDAGLADAVGDGLEQQPHEQDRRHRERWVLHRDARRSVRYDVRRQVTR